MSANEEAATSRQTHWCHQCLAQIIPLMSPNPVCPRCHGDFVEEIEADNDPRDFLTSNSQEEDEMENEFGGAGSYNQEFQTAVQDLLSNLLGGQQINSNQQPTTETETGTETDPETEETTAPGGMRTWSSRLGNGHVSVSVGTMSPEEMRRAFNTDDPQQRTHMFIDPEENAPMSFGNLLNSLMGVLTNGPQREGGGATFFGGTGGGNFGDYVWGQRNFDDIITQIMEQHQGAHVPPPASEETIGKLPQHKISLEEAKKGAECGICMEEYKVDEVAVELPPCKHMYHKECIDHWLGMNGTCPICRARIGPEPKPPRSHSEIPGSFPQQTNQPDHEPLD